MASSYSPAPLLERERELMLTLDAWHAAEAGRGSIWYVCAEAGGGKTRLPRELAGHATGGAILWGAAEPVLPPEPFLAVSRAIPGFSPAPLRGESVARAVELIDHAAGTRPVLIVLGDLHFADEGTIALIVRLSEVCRRRPWMAVAAFRPEEGPAALRLAMTETLAQDSARRLLLAPLSREGVAQLAAVARGGALSAAEAEAIHREGGGNPWYTEALARGNGMMATARDRLVLHIGRLEGRIPSAPALLARLAPAARPLPDTVVVHLHGGDTPALRHTLSALRADGALREERGGWVFRHELLRRAVWDGMLALERREAHLRMAQALEQTTRDGVPAGSTAELTMHYAEGDDSRAFAWALQAAREARAADAHTEALAQLQRALGFAPDHEARRETLMLAATEGSDLGRVAESRAFAEQGLAITGGEPQQRARLHQLAAHAASRLGDIVGDEAHIEAADAVLADQPAGPIKANIAVARVARAVNYVRPERIEPAVAAARRLARELEPAAAATVEAQVLTFPAVAGAQQGDPACFGLLEQARSLVSGHALMPGITLTGVVNVYTESVISLFHGQATTLYDEALEEMARRQLDWQRNLMPARLLELVQTGRFAEAARYADLIAPESPGSYDHALVMCAMSIHAARAGSPLEAQRLLGETPSSDPFGTYTLARLEAALVRRDRGLDALGAEIYAEMDLHRQARIAGTAAMAIARAGHRAPSPPAWLAAAAPLRVLWD